MHTANLGTLHNVEEVAMAVRELLLMQDPDSYRGGIFQLVQISDRCISVPGDCVE
jgi:hypothetical protein